MFHLVVRWKFTDASELLTASIIRAMRKTREKLSEISGSYGCEYEDECVLGCCAA
jgi:hypothetical protein